MWQGSWQLSGPWSLSSRCWPSWSPGAAITGGRGAVMFTTMPSAAGPPSARAAGAGVQCWCSWSPEAAIVSRGRGNVMMTRPSVGGPSKPRDVGPGAPRSWK
jgi:hypothetical protein